MLPLKTGPTLPEQSADPVETLFACHERIRHFTTVALRLARSPNAPVRLIVDTASTLKRYFGSTLPLHERDEEDFVTPRLLESRPARSLEMAIARMSADHHAMDDELAALDALWTRVALRPSDLHSVGEDMHERARRLSSLFESHLQLEEETILPAVTMLPDAIRKLISVEIRCRRTSEVRKASDPDPTR